MVSNNLCIQEDKVRKFYNNFSSKLLKDYIHGNLRIEAAIKFTISSMPIAPTNILDIGCGIGWSSWEIKRHYPKASILGVDISSESIKIANQLFSARKSLCFSSQDVVSILDFRDHFFDAIIMIDSYEHIPRESRDKLHLFLNSTLKNDGVVILTFPSVFHQKYLRENKPNGLQPIDEDVAIEDMLRLASDIKGYIAYFAFVDIWHKNDYVHVVIKRGMEKFSKKIWGSNTQRVKLESLFVRKIRVGYRFGFKLRQQSS